MLIVRDWKSADFSGVVLSIGNFDGVHLGHRAILKAALDRANAVDSRVVVLTFEPHPSSLLTPDRVPPTLTPLHEKLRLLESAGVSATVLVQTDWDFLRLSADQFISDVILSRFKPLAVVEGQTFGFGAHRKGDVHTLSLAGHRDGFAVEIVQPVRVGLGGPPETIVSSSLVRHLLASGTVGSARLCLGRPYALFGRIEHGAARGAKLGFPTANLKVIGQMIPAEGVYAGVAFLGGPPRDGKADADDFAQSAPLAAAISIGRNPTFEQSEITVEAFLLDYSGDLYDCSMRLEFIEWIRPQQRFENSTALVEQINSDVALNARTRSKALIDSRSIGS